MILRYQNSLKLSFFPKVADSVYDFVFNVIFVKQINTMQPALSSLTFYTVSVAAKARYIFFIIKYN